MDAKEFFLINISIYAGCPTRRAQWSQEALDEIGLKEDDLEAVKAILNAEIIDPAWLRPFLKLRKQVQEWLTAKGERHPLVGWLINPNERQQVLERLEAIKAEYEQEKTKFLLNYEAACEQQLQKVRMAAEVRGLNPDPLVEAVRAKQPRREYYEREMQFEFFDSTLVVDSNEWAAQIRQIENDLRGRTIWHIERTCEEISQQERPSARCRNLLKLGEKLASVSFYLSSLKGQGGAIQQAVTQYLGGVQKSSAYTQVQSLASIKLAKLIRAMAMEIVDGQLDRGE